MFSELPVYKHMTHSSKDDRCFDHPCMTRIVSIYYVNFATACGLMKNFSYNLNIVILKLREKLIC